MKKINWIGYNWISKLVHWLYWKKWHEFKILYGNVLFELDTLDKLTEFMKSITYCPDPLFGAFHWIQEPLTTVHRGIGNCDDYARLWHDRLTAIGHESHIYIMYRKKFWINWPVHFVCAWRKKHNWRVPYILHWTVASNTEANMVAWYNTEADAVEAYRREYNYSRFRRLTEREITGE